MEETKQDNLTDLYPNGAFKELTDAGVFLGRKKTKTHPRMRPYILTTRNEIEIINLQKTTDDAEKAVAFIKEKVRNNGVVVVVGTQPQAADAVAAFAKEIDIPYVNVRWLGGLITNFKVLSKRIEYYKKLKSELKSGALEKYTKKERLGFEKELLRLDELLGGLENYNAVPEVLLVIDPNPHMTAVREAKRLGIPVVAYVNTDIDPEVVDYPVVGNTKARKSISWFLGKMTEAVNEGKIAAAAKAKETVEAVAAQAEVSK
ncbi:MAG: 30S ribosomal protein S2 [Candidatus Liptonbacteria bacterium RIFCSPLOWO2_01_FULL_45_15]|uniref:Small ribosomal subunit protein uS2 n=1 Tax=Candidatus Liptonbacteria bacterium RIFCSPLOWO2_01_FULL_45_15 TaxID=1798649 RepID=A0A1G2CHM4_9BACT|nr:MAG: 30S ribosomal protein S2 [Candidatus Liptonbacteria bacterium RIFCSPLOWO2_01_FULL_45_15]